MATLDTGKNGFFTQKRVGRRGKLFKMIKIRSMRPVKGFSTNVTTKKDPRISKIGAFFRQTKLDELPQLFNVLIGRMSFVGPRPDVPGYADKLEEEDRIMIELRPGITGPASIFFKDEEEILANQNNPQQFNDEVIWPSKVEINKWYYRNYRFIDDIQYILMTVIKLNQEQKMNQFTEMYNRIKLSKS
jgi:lipopolysaccharide/colanic/teichoic acid biosynthesis glycosyltransferase